MLHLTAESPIGPLILNQEGEAIVSIDWGRMPQDRETETPLLREAKRQLDGYFAGKVKQFELPLAPTGVDFHRQVWQLMCEIPYGETMTYGEMGKRLGAIARNVGTACGTNPIPVIIPCHRVVGAGGRMVGYSGRGGVETKLALLKLEGVPLLL